MGQPVTTAWFLARLTEEQFKSLKIWMLANWGIETIGMQVTWLPVEPPQPKPATEIPDWPYSERWYSQDRGRFTRSQFWQKVEEGYTAFTIFTKENGTTLIRLVGDTIFVIRTHYNWKTKQLVPNRFDYLAHEKTEFRGELRFYQLVAAAIQDLFKRLVVDPHNLHPNLLGVSDRALSWEPVLWNLSWEEVTALINWDGTDPKEQK